MSEEENKIEEVENIKVDSDDGIEEIWNQEFIKGNFTNENRYNNIIKTLNNIKNKIKNYNNKIDQIKTYLINLKKEKSIQQKKIINLISKKESLEEVYKNRIFAFKNKKENNFDQPEKISINLQQFKKIEINEFIEKVLSMTDDLLDKSGKNINKNEIKKNLKVIINNSYKIIINNNITKNKSEISIDNFITQISLFISNQSFGIYSEEDINIFLRYLININITNEEIAKTNKFINKKYKEKKTEFKNAIKNLENKKELFLTIIKNGQKSLENMKNNMDELYLQSFNFNINNARTNSYTNESTNQNYVGIENNKIENNGQFYTNSKDNNSELKNYQNSGEYEIKINNKNNTNEISKDKNNKSPPILPKTSVILKDKNNINNINNNQKIYYNKKRKGAFIKSKAYINKNQEISLTEQNEMIKKNNKNNYMNFKNNKQNNDESKDKKINSELLQNLDKKIAIHLLSNEGKNNNEDNDIEKKLKTKINSETTENIINKLLSPKIDKIKFNKNNSLSCMNKKNLKEKYNNNNLKKFLTTNGIISNNIKNNNEITLPISNQPISNKISKLNLNIFITQNKETNEANNINEPNIIRNRNQENHAGCLNGNGIENDNVINGMNEDYFINIDDNNINNTKSHINKNNYRKINLNKKIFEDRNRILINEKFFSYNNEKKTVRKIKIFSGKNQDITNINENTRSLKSQCSLFYNTHDFSINNNYGGTINKSMKKQKKLLIKNISNSNKDNNSISRKKIKNNSKYLDFMDSNRFNTKNNNSLSKSLNNNNFYSLNNDKFKKRKKLYLPSNSKNRNYKDILIDIDNKQAKNLIKNKNNKNKILTLNKNKNRTFNIALNTIGTDTNNISNFNNKVYDTTIINNRNKDNNISTNRNKNKNNKNDLKKLLENNLKNIIPKTHIHFNPKKIFAEGVMESFCYFKILDKDSQKFNPLDSYSINPESLGYAEGYISLDLILGQFRIIPKNIMSKNFKSNNKNNVLSHSNSLSLSEYTLFNNGNNVFRFEIDKNEKKNCIRIDLKNINGVKINKSMQDIIKIHKIFIKYNSHSGFEYENEDGKIKKKVLSINKLLYMKEVSEINMEQNEKIKAALCNFFALTIIFGNYKINKVECIFINFDLFNIWFKCLEMIAENNNKSKNSLIILRGALHKKCNSNLYNNINN